MDRKFLNRIFIAAGAGFCMALSKFGAPPSAALLALAARGMWGDAGVLPRTAAALWGTGGGAALTAVFWLGVWVAWSAGFFVAATVVGRFLPQGRSRLAIWILVAAFAAFGLARGVAGFFGREALAVSYPVDLAKAAQGHKAFANPSARIALALWGGAQSFPPATDSLAMCADPSKWRAASREAGWDAVLLSGPSDEFSKLLRHLMESPDWRLAAMSEQGWLFLRDGGARVSPPDPAKVDAGSPLATARVLAQLSDRFQAEGATREARESIMRALELAPDDARVQLYAARFNAALKAWHNALKHSENALRAGLRVPAAYSIKALASLESGDLETARAAAESALGEKPDDRYALFLLARICRAQKDVASEIETLKRLVRVAGSDGPALAYLGQAYALDGNAEAAQATYRKALDAPGLDETQKKAIREALENVEKYIRH